MKFAWHTLVLLVIAVAITGSATIWACPFCSVTSQTLSEEIEASDAAILARLVKGAQSPPPGPDALGGFGVVDPDTGMATFAVREVIKGADRLTGVETVEAVFFGPPETEKSFLITGIGSELLEWNPPLPITEEAVAYVRKLPTLPAKGADRLEFFQDYLQDDDPLLAQDAYDEFARAPYQEVIDLSDRMDHDRLVTWITDPDVSPSQRRLFLTMLGVCGSEDDLPMLKDMILSDYRTHEPIVEGLVQSGLALGGSIALPLITEVVEMDERRKKLGLDALIACYLKLAGPAGLEIIADRFLRDHGVEYTHTYQTLMALRFHGEETDVIPRPQLLEAVRLLLDHPDFADQVIPDLARWEDWEVLDRLVQMFKDADERSFVKQPIVTYLVVASEQEGDVGRRGSIALEQLEEIDAEAVERAQSLMAFGFLGRARPAGDAKNYTRDGSPFEESGEDEDAAGESAVSDAAASEIPHPTDPAFAEGAADARAPSFVQDPIEEDAADGDFPVEETTPAAGAPNSQGSKGAVQVASTQGGSDRPTHADRAVEELAVPNTALIVSVPLISAALLTGFFWLILRSGGA